jgi:ATP-dependent RNA helicase DDX56/DBP9
MAAAGAGSSSVGGGADGDQASAGAAAGGVSGKLSQYWVSCKPSDKFLVVFALLKLNRIPGRSLIFVNDVTCSFRLKLFLEQFGVHCGVLNAELPLNSRWHTIQAFNKGAFDFLIATDDPVLRAAPGDADGGKGGKGEGGGGKGGGKRRKGNTKGKDEEGGGKGAQQQQWQSEFGVSRGIDFQGVTAVINYDLPSSIPVYQHRIGRTARAGLEGTSISLVSSGEASDGAYLAELQALYGEGLKPLHVEYSKLNSFRYRVDDATRAVTRAAVNEARLRELRNELLNSERLKAHFESNPADLHVLKHDKPLATVRSAPELKRIPKYLLPDRRDAVDGQLTTKMAAIASAARKQRSRHKLVGKGKRKADPLKTLKASKGPRGKHRNARSAVGKRKST